METVTETASTRRPGPDEADAELAARLRLSVMRLARRLRSQADEGVSASQLSALSTLGRGPALTLGELSAAERVKPPTMTRIVAALEEQGLVTRTTDPSDRRVARVALSEQGRRLIEGNRRRKDAYLAARLAALDPADRVALERALGALDALLEGPQ